MKSGWSHVENFDFSGLVARPIRCPKMNNFEKYCPHRSITMLENYYYQKYCFSDALLLKDLPDCGNGSDVDISD
ncbi:hypothetical protein EVAR_96120_1 [Eumeta japonica]|uniref:Uncharacterized protein n=1 Tax=Eumeta variegata TaxID=151549 RepID=A0A4C1VE45_EUMVA|nr:hypothetical protein EVAR_96120_1 [Eumeta japonica]